MSNKYPVADIMDNILLGIFKGTCRATEEIKHAYFHIARQEHEESSDMFSVCYHMKGKEPRFTI